MRPGAAVLKPRNIDRIDCATELKPRYSSLDPSSLSSFRISPSSLQIRLPHTQILGAPLEGEKDELDWTALV